MRRAELRGERMAERGEYEPGQYIKAKREAREFINNGAISINGTVVKDAAYEVTPACAIEGSVVVIRRGKKKFYLGEF